MEQRNQLGARHSVGKSNWRKWSSGLAHWALSCSPTTEAPTAGVGARFDPLLQNISSATYSSGGTFSGTGTCNVAILGGTATGTIAVTSGSPGSTITITSAGGGYNPTASYTSGTLTSGTATCSGTATIAVVLGGATAGGDTTWKVVLVMSSIETAYDTGLSQQAQNATQRIRVRSTASGEVGITVGSASESRPIETITAA